MTQENYSVHKSGPERQSKWGWLLCESPWRKKAEGCSLPQENPCEAPHQPPGTNINQRQSEALKGKKVIARNKVNISNSLFLPRASAVQCMFGRAVGKQKKGYRQQSYAAELLNCINTF